MVDVPFVTDHSNPGATFFGSWNVGDVVTISWTGIRVDSPCGPYGYAVACGGNAHDYGEVHYAVATTASSRDITIAVATTYLDVTAFTSSFCSTGEIFGLTVTSGVSSYCQYGTQPKPGVTSGIIVTTALVDLLLTALALSPAYAIIFDTFVGTVLWGGDLCAGLPPLMPTFDNSDYIGGVPNIVNPVSREKFWTALQAVAWPEFCQCNPAPPLRPDPLPPPLPTGTPPAAAPPGPVVISCDGGDLCDVLNALVRQVTAMQTQLSAVLNISTLIQRQGVPFAYVPGTLHSGLTGAGQFAVQGILGLAVQVTMVPGASGEEAGDPIARFGLGWVTTGTADGWRTSVPIRHNPQWVDVEPDDTLVGYSLDPLVVANLQEFVREP